MKQLTTNIFTGPHHAITSEQAFLKLASKCPAMCAEWNITVANLRAHGPSEVLHADVEFRKHYDAVVAATTVPTKRDAMRAFLRMWRERLLRELEAP